MRGQETQMVTRGNLEVSDLGPGREKHPWFHPTLQSSGLHVLEQEAPLSPFLQPPTPTPVAKEARASPSIPGWSG